ncbi:phosphoribosyl transferase [Pleurocapsa sp. CCALA 161]|uniref:phosphoribosyltransferase n=1 Tax=Pleurocapsa sp. CCALA 161 TaxID=2107688 RepID=UPI000D0652FB|nr:phosphoribosyltransferase family protein [Pleurocapsa sp. CCALA 161]PSB09327.1 phosphoribosyl transferase [Pleurocapsa sp. CCALA 161]
MKPVFSNRREAGKKLAQKLTAYANHPQAIVLGLPRGGVPVAYEIAKTLNLPLDVCLVKKLGLPNNPETAMGAVVEDELLPDYCGNITIINQNTTQIHGVNSEQLRAIAAQAKVELRWRDRCYRSFRPLLKISQHIVIIVDDGIATGQTMEAAVTVLRRHKPKKIIIATPVASKSAIEQLATQVDDFICLIKPKYLGAVDFCYEDFTQTTDREVCDLLSQMSYKTLVTS